MDEEDEHFLSASHQKCILLSGKECHIINYLLTELAQAVPGNTGPRSFLSQPRANIPQYGPRTRLVRGYYCPPHVGYHGSSEREIMDNSRKITRKQRVYCK